MFIRDNIFHTYQLFLLLIGLFNKLFLKSLFTQKLDCEQALRWSRACWFWSAKSAQAEDIIFMPLSPIVYAAGGIMFSTFPSVCVFMHLGGGIPSWLVIDF